MNTTLKKAKCVEVKDSQDLTEEDKPIEKAFKKAKEEEDRKKKLGAEFKPPAKKRKADTVELKLSNPLGINATTDNFKKCKSKQQAQKECQDTQDQENILAAMERLTSLVEELRDSIGDLVATLSEAAQED